ncbi:hypothetical protein PHMEG_0004449 [Phytophthora megakarya]|uniref:Uncharacterized protein n=1 Tax=Phytophthora megakarya TaxID=4795 RepID=A0A225WTR4_9STRA|nr:hypothetical protein PHMEG_0004449 [Phytophthora megakarya]
MYLTSTDQRAVTGNSTFGNVRSAIVYLYITTKSSRDVTSSVMTLEALATACSSLLTRSNLIHQEQQPPPLQPKVRANSMHWTVVFIVFRKHFCSLSERLELFSSFGALGFAIDTAYEALYVIQIEESPAIRTKAFNAIDSGATNT